MTKNRLTAIESWLRFVGLSLLVGIGFVLLLHDLDNDVPTMAWGWSLLARVSGAGLMYLAYRASKTLHEWGMLPTILTGEELDDKSYGDERYSRLAPRAKGARDRGT